MESSVNSSSEVEYMGMIVNKDGVRPMYKTLDKLRMVEFPQSKKELKSFMGLANFLCQFCRGKDLLHFISKMTGLLKGRKKVSQT